MLRERHLELCQRIKDAGGQPYVVGGFVRDLLLGRNPKDVDVVAVGIAPEALFDALGEPEIIGDHFPVMLAGDVEVAVARTETKTGVGYHGFSCEIKDVTLEQDLKRRDLTINAMAMDPFTGDLIDPYKGAKDLAAGLLRPVGPHF